MGTGSPSSKSPKEMVVRREETAPLWKWQMIFRLHDFFKLLNEPPKIPATLHAQDLPDIIPKGPAVRVTNSSQAQI